jgi:uncharacterized protein YndB with AHSA1/START domain
MNEFTIVAVIRRPVDEVFAVIRDVGRTPLWMPGLNLRTLMEDHAI